MKIALFLPNWIGDAVMATPALRAVRRHFDKAEIVAVLRPYVADVLAGLDLVDRMLLHEPRGSEAENRGWRFAAKLRSEQFDSVLLFPNSLRSGWLAWLSGAKQRVGFARDLRSLLLSDALVPQPRSEPNPVIDEYLRLAAHLGCRDLTHQMELATSSGDEKNLARFWAGQDSRLRTKGLVCLNPGGAFGAAKHWPAHYFGELARKIATEQDKTVLVLCGPAERDEARYITAYAGHRHVVSLARGPLTIGLTKAAIKSAELLVTTDSGPRHFAPPFGVPVLTLFGPTHIAWSETFAPHAVHLQQAVDCGPCQQRTCPLAHHRCMHELTVDRVYAETVALLESTKSAAALAS